MGAKLWTYKKKRDEKKKMNAVQERRVKVGLNTGSSLQKKKKEKERMDQPNK